MVKSFDFAEFRDNGRIDFWTNYVQLIRSVGLPNILKYLPTETHKTMENFTIILGSYCHQARKQCRFLTMSILEVLVEYFTTIDKSEVVEKITGLKPVWEQIMFQ